MLSFLPHEEITLRVYDVFSIHCRQVIDKFWDESTLGDPNFVPIRLNSSS
jgi:hypothetical protein